MSKVPEIDFLRIHQEMLTQYVGARKLHTWIEARHRVFKETIGDFLYQMDRSKSPSNINGWMLDFLGTLLGIVRPTRTATGLTYWGFQNQPGAGTFGQVPFWTAESGLETRVPVDDGIYRRLLYGRARRLRSRASKEDLLACLNALFPSGTNYLQFNSNGSITVNCDTDDTVLFDIVTSAEYRDLVLPLTPSRAFTLNRV